MKNVEDVYPLSPMQKGMLFHSLYSGERGAYVEQVGWTLNGAFDETLFELAWRQVIAHHPALRTCFFWDDLKEPLQVVRQKVELRWQRDDQRDLSLADQQERLQVFLESDRRQGFDLSKAPLVRLTQTRVSENSYRVIWTYHHLILDGWSVSLILKEVLQCYKALRRGIRSEVEDRRPFRDYVRWLQHQDTQLAEAYWRERLRGFEAPASLSVEKPSGTAASEKESYAVQQVQLSRAATEKLRTIARRHQLTLSILVEGAWTLLLSRYNDASEIVFGIVVTGRPSTLPGVEAMVGLFINTLPMRVSVPPAARCIAWLKELQQQQIEMLQYEYTPLAQIHEWSDVPRGQQIFRTIIAFDNVQEDEALGSGEQNIKISDVFRANTRTNYPLTLGVVAADELSLQITYDEGRFDSVTITRMMDHLESLVTGFTDDREHRLSSMSLLKQNERHQLLSEWNDTAVRYSEEASIPELFEAQVKRTAEAPAVVFEGAYLTYAELNRKANKLAHHLRSLGVGPETLVAIYAERAFEMVWGLLGILKAGAAYLPLDPAYPRDGLAFILADSDVAVLLTQRHLGGALPEHRARVIFLDGDFLGESEANLSVRLEPGSIAYAIYTSGSTGRPKAALNTHQGIINRLRWMQDTYDLTVSDRVLQKTPFTFDVSVWEFFWPLTTGAQLVLAKPGGHQDNAYLVDLMAAHEVSTVHFVPSMLRPFLETENIEKCSSLKRVICSGEDLPLELQQRFFTRLDAQLHNLYGPTEAAVDVTSWRCPGECRNNLVSIGRPISNIRVYLLDRALQPVPVGVPGELHIGGIGVARGYLNRADLTAENFIPDPFSDEAGMRLYKTGDLARYLADGNIQLLGRLDSQIKLRGFRIELGDIESRLTQHPAVREAVAIALGGPHSEKRLVAYVTPLPGHWLRPGELQRFLKERLPSYMVPSAFVVLEHLPLTASGKLDRRALPAPGSMRPDLEEPFIPPRTPTEEALVAIWKELLGIEQVGIDDNFFELGGDSIISMQVVSRAKQAGLHLVPRDLFEHQTIALLAAAAATLEIVQNADQGIVTGPLPLTPIQRWFFEQRSVAPHHFNQAVLLEARQSLNPHLIQVAVEKLVAHHDALRLRFFESESDWRQVNAAREEATIFRYVDLSELPDPAREFAMSAAANELQAGLNLSRGPIIQVALFHFGRGKPAQLFLVVHHLAVDGVSWRILLADLQTAYDQLLSGAVVSLPRKTTSFRKWAEGLSEAAQLPEIQRDADYWLAESKKIVQPLPLDFARGENTVAFARNLEVSLSAKETRSLLQDIPKAFHLQVPDVLMAALAQAFTRWTGQNHLLINLEGHGRESLYEDIDVTSTVGWFTSLFPVRLEFDEKSQPGAALRSIKEKLKAVPNRGIGYGLLRYLDESAGASFRDAPQAEVCFNYLGQFDQALAESRYFQDGGDAPGLTQTPRSNRSHLLDINGGIVGGQLVFLWTYGENLHLQTTIEGLAQDFIEALRALIVYCQSGNAEGFTPADFPLASLKQDHVDELTRDERLVEDIYALSPMQEGMLFHALRSPQSQVYCEQMTFSLQGKLDIPAFERAWQEVVGRRSIFRTAFVWRNLDEPVQVVYRRVGLPLERHDWQGLTQKEQSERIENFHQADRKRGLDLSYPPVMRLTLVQMGEESFELVWTYHHILLDGWSVPLVFREVVELYDEFKQGRQPPHQISHSYREYIVWLKQQDVRKAEAFWREKLDGFTAPTPLISSTEPHARHGEKDGYDQQEIVLSATLANGLRALARAHHLTLNTLAQGCWALLLSRYSGERDVVFGATVSGRSAELAGSEAMIGLFINTQPVRVKVAGDESLLTWLKELQVQQAEASQYAYSPLSQVQAWSDLPRGVPLFESLMVFENYPLNASLDQASQNLEISSARTVERTDYPLTLIVVPGEELALRLLYDCGRFGRTMMTRMLLHLERLLEGLATNVERNVCQLPLTSEVENHATLVEWNDTRARYPDACFHQLVERRVAEVPGALAISFEGRHLTYGELNGRANQLSHYLRSLGVGPEVRVGICLARSSEMVIGRLAVLKAGAAYVSLDPEYPVARLGFMLEDARASVLLTEKRFLDRLVDLQATIVCVDSDREVISQQSQNNPNVQVDSNNLAYVYYSSGSTGRPKGVQIEQAGLVNLVTWHNHAYRVTAADRKSQLSGLAFDASVWELWPYLVAGASVHIPNEETRASWPKLLKWLVTEAITICFLPTPLAEAVMDHEWPEQIALRALLTGGDKLHRWPKQLLPFSFVNKYGPTEVSAVTTWAPMTPISIANPLPPIGRPIANTQTFVLDHHFQPVPLGAPGELCIGGVGVARGYLNRPDLTAERFIPHPFANEPGARLYRSGDLVRYLSDGNLEFLGRNDYQVKIRGYRIELGEIEKTIAEHCAVREAVVLLHENPSGGNQLVAYFVSTTEPVLTVSELREFLKERLPEYMVPAIFVCLSCLPLTPNGKIDRRALPTPRQSDSALTRTNVGPRTPVEATLAEIWAQVLRLERVSIHDNFFELGGDSILSIRIIARAGQKGIELSPNQLFLHPTISGLTDNYDLTVRAQAPSSNAEELQSRTSRQGPVTGGLTVAGFPNADLNQDELKNLLAHLTSAK